MPLPPEAEHQWWYQYYFATERGRAGYDKYLHDFAKLIWQIASPKWDFDDATFDRSAAAFDNPDHVASRSTTIAGGWGWPRRGAYDELEKRLAEGPVITVPPSRSRVTPTVRPIRTRGLCREVLGHVFAPDDRGRHRAQPSAGSSGSVCPGHLDADAHVGRSSHVGRNASLTVVLVHGAFADASSWNGVVERLPLPAMQVTAPADPLRGIGKTRPISPLLEDPGPGPRGRPLVRGCGDLERRHRPAVVGLVFVAAFAPDEGEVGEVTPTSKDSVLMSFRCSTRRN